MIRVFLKVSSMKDVMQLENKDKLSPKYVEPYRFPRGVGQVAYEVDLPPE